MPAPRPAVVAAAVLAAAVPSALGQGAAGGRTGASVLDESAFEFVVPTLSCEATAGSPIDLSRLNAMPAGSNGFLRGDGGAIVDGQGDAVLLFGTNISDLHTMPPADLARPIARRLAELGVNFARLHYSDYAPAPDGLMRPDMRTVDPRKLDELHNLVAELKAAGIYTDLNLHVARRYPATPDDWRQGMAKGIDRILPSLVEDQKAFARQVLEPVNPHTGLALKEDPAVAIVEVNNENTLLDHHTRLGSLTGEAGEAVRGMWNDWLRAKYGDTAALTSAWNAGVDAAPARGEGNETLENPDFADGQAGWYAEAHGGRSDLTAADGTLTWAVREPGVEAWAHQLHQADLDVEDGGEYVLSVEYKSDVPVSARLMHQESPWDTVSEYATLPPSEDFTTVETALKVGNPQGRGVRLTIETDNETGTIEFRKISLRPGGLPGLAEGQRLEDAGVPVPGADGSIANTAAWDDFRDFAIDREMAYSAEMARFLRDDLGVKAMIFDTQAGYGNSIGLVREHKLDVIDMHQYPTHPTLLGEQGEARTWRVPNRSALIEVDPDYPGVTALAFWNALDRPFGVSEFDVNPPGDFNSESFPLFALMAAYQGWDMLGEYTWLNFQPTYEPDTMTAPFHTSANSGQIVFMPVSALLYRQGLVEPAGEVRTLRVHEQNILDDRPDHVWLNSLWRELGLGGDDAWRTGVRVDLRPGEGEPSITPDVDVASPDVPEGVAVSDTGQIRVDRTDADRPVLTLDAPAAKLALGFTAGKRFDLSGATIEVLDAGGVSGEVANVGLIALDERPVGESRRLLLVTVARVLPAGLRFLDESLETFAPGPGPMLAEPLDVRVTLPGDGWAARMLDEAGRPIGEAIGVEDGTFETDGRETLWYLIERG